MKKFLIEIPHSSNQSSCDHAIKVFKESGSHFLTHADWGCHDGVHKAWLIAEVDSRDQALSIIPPYYRESATIVELIKLSSVDDMAHNEFHKG